jgi:hypothetical protein
MKTYVFSYCVFGSQEKYCLGMLKNLQQIETLFPNYKVWIYLGNDVPIGYIEKYKLFDNVTLIHHNFTGGRLTAYRYFILDKGFDVVLIRDADSRFGKRDIWCIHNFLNCVYKIFTIRDNEAHNHVLMAGLTGFKGFHIKNIQELYNNFIDRKNQDYYWNDQHFIAKHIFEPNINDIISYTSYHKFNEKETIEIPFLHDNKADFCGCVILFDSNGNEYPWI